MDLFMKIIAIGGFLQSYLSGSRLAFYCFIANLFVLILWGAQDNYLMYWGWYYSEDRIKDGVKGAKIE